MMAQPETTTDAESYWVTVEKAQAEYLSAHDKALDEAERQLAEKLENATKGDNS